MLDNSLEMKSKEVDINHHINANNSKTANKSKSKQTIHYSNAQDNLLTHEF